MLPAAPQAPSMTHATRRAATMTSATVAASGTLMTGIEAAKKKAEVSGTMASGRKKEGKIVTKTGTGTRPGAKRSSVIGNAIGESANMSGNGIKRIQQTCSLGNGTESKKHT